MSQLLYPHLRVAVDTEPFYADLVAEYPTAPAYNRNRIRNEIRQRRNGMSAWLIDHGYQCGPDYQQTASGYRFASDALATFFRLAWS